MLAIILTRLPFIQRCRDLLSVDEVPGQHTGPQAFDDMRTGGISLGPPGAQDAYGLGVVDWHAGLLQRPLVQLERVKVWHGCLVPHQSVDGENDGRLLARRIHLRLGTDLYSLIVRVLLGLVPLRS